MNRLRTVLAALLLIAFSLVVRRLHDATAADPSSASPDGPAISATLTPHPGASQASPAVAP